MAAIDLLNCTLNEFTEEMVNYIHRKEYGASNDKSPFFEVEEKIKDIIEGGAPRHNVICAIGTLVVLSDIFADENQKELSDYLNEDEKGRLKNGIQERHKLIYQTWICELIEPKKRPIDPTPTGASWQKYIGSTSLFLFRNDISEKANGIKGTMLVQEAQKKIIEYLESIKIDEKYIKVFEDIYEKLLSLKGEKTMPTSNDSYSYEKYKKQITDAIEKGVTQIILTGAPGTGKTKMAKEIAGEIGTDLTCKNGGDKKYEFVQFHPSYDYTDFIEGLRPVESESGSIEFKKIDGIFKRFCRYVATLNEKEEVKKKEEEKKYFFLIDEINRADLSKVFGELMYCLESDKRGAENAVQTQYQTLKQYFTEKDKDNFTKDIFEDGFYIPKNVYIIGTMNDIDRSVESMDFALRRRFLWKEIEVNENLLRDAFKSMFSCGDSVAEQLAKRVMALNDVISSPTGSGRRFGLNKHYYISQGQFANLKNISEPKGDNTSNDAINDFLKEVFELRIKPLLQEYVRGEEEGEVEKFVEACKNKLLNENKEKSDSESSSGDQEVTS